jgi:hypothetical protein
LAARDDCADNAAQPSTAVARPVEGEISAGHRLRVGSPRSSGIVAYDEGRAAPQERSALYELNLRPGHRQITAELFLTEKTVETHLRNIVRKMNVSSRVELALAVERGDHAPRRQP